MPPLFYNATQAAFEIGISYRTVRRRIEAGEIQATRGADGQYSIAALEVQRLKQAQSERPRPAMSGHAETSHNQSDLEQRVADLEQRMKIVEDTISHNHTVPATPKPRPQHQPSIAKRNSLSEGCILASKFAEAHGVNRSTFTEHMLQGRGPGLIGTSTDTIPERDYVDYGERPKPGRPKERERYLDPEQQKGAISFWQRHNVSFSQCEMPECWCHTP